VRECFAKVRVLISTCDCSFRCAVGSGTGVVGIVVALLAKPAALVLSDRAEQLDLIRRNVAAARSRFPALNWDVVSVQEFDWAQPTVQLSPPPPFDFVLASDCVWPKVNNALLIDALLRVTDHHTVIYQAYEYRGESCRQTFFEPAQRHFHFARISDDELHPSFRADDIELYRVTRLRSDAPLSPASPPQPSPPPSTSSPASATGSAGVQ
jgi:hypothetical protein